MKTLVGCNGCLKKRRGIAVRGLLLALLLASLAGGLRTPQGASADGGTGTVYSHFYGCDVQGAPAYQDHAFLAQVCTGSTYYLNWSLVSEGSSYSPIQSAGPTNVRFENVPNHIFTLTGDFGIYSGPAIVYCQNGDANTADGYELMDVADTNMGNVIHPTMGSAGYVTCDWYGTSAVTAVEGSATISISAWQCPDDFNLAGADKNVLPTTCATPLNGIDFSVESANNPKDVETTGTDADGRVFFQYLSADFVQITGVQVGASTPRVFCRGALNGGTDGFETAELPAINATFPYNLLDGEALTCDWYDVPAQPAQIYLNAHLCPSGPDLSQADMNTLAAACQLTMNGVPFTVTPHKDATVGAVTGESSASSVLFQDLIPGKTTIEASSIAGFASRVFCDQVLPGDSGAAHYTERDVQDGAISTTLDPGEELNCDWFELNDGGVSGAGGVALTAFACPAGFDAGSTHDLTVFTGTCIDPLNGVAYTLAALAGDLTGTTGVYQDGAVNFYGVPQQGAVIVAAPPDGLDTAAVFCGQALSYNGQPNGFDQMPTYAIDSIQAEIVPGAQETCRWFFNTGTANNAVNDQSTPVATADTASEDATNGQSGGDQSADDGQGDSGNAGDQQPAAEAGTVTIVNHLCPSGFDAANTDINDLYAQCTGDGSGFVFSLTTEGTTATQTSGDAIASGAEWTGVPEHAFTIEEGLPDGYGAGAVYCTASTGESTYYPGSAIHPTFSEGASLFCDWFTAQS